jgi:hypothetical protein
LRSRLQTGECPNGLSFHRSNLHHDYRLYGGLAVLAVASRMMKRILDHAATARRYANCAQESIRHANNAINERERKYHTLIAVEYLSLAKQELTAGYRHNSAKHPDEHRGAL